MMAKNYVEGEQSIKNAVADARVIVNNGDTKSMKTVEIGDAIQCKNDVAYVSQIWDDVEIETMVYVKVGSKHVVLRKYHPVVTENGPVVACELRKGMKVLTKENGFELVERVSEVNYYDRVIDLDLRREKISNVADNVFYMNGIAVGDYTYENHLEYM